MLLPRGLTKKKLDIVSVKRRRVEDKERLFNKPTELQPLQNVASTQTPPTLEKIIWTNAVYVSLFESRFSSDDLKLVRCPILEFVTCHSIALKARLTEVAPLELVGAIRLAGEERIQIRLALNADEAEAGSAFEFRLLDTDGNEVIEATNHVAYLESIPAPYQSIMGVTNLVYRNFSSNKASAVRIRGVVPVGLSVKNEASYEQVLVTFSDHMDREDFLQRVPWHDQATSQRSPAFCACLRACSLERFTALKEEYLAHQNKLNTAMILEPSAARPIQPEHEHTQAAPARAKPAPPPPVVPLRSHHLDYPPGRLLFLRNVPTTTNKTAIRADMTAFLAEHSSVDYVDWSKGHDTAHIRLGKAISEESLANILETSKLEGESKVELLSGERESLYWSRLPEKIRAAAMAS